jgi:transcriptional regulator GlxA family with amidase domain
VTRRIVIVAFEGVQSLDVIGPLEVFSAASQLAKGAAYEVTVVAPRAGVVRCSSSVALVAERALQAERGPLDTLVIAGGPGVAAAARDRRFMDAVLRQAKRARRVVSVCTGALLLAELGLLDGKRATTHWSACSALAALHPRVQVERDPIFVRDGRVFTSAGVTAGMDLALALVEDDLGAEVALAVARWLVLFVQRPGGQSQFSAALAAKRADRGPIRDLQGWIPDHLDADLSVTALARRARMSPRNFARVFVREVGQTPSAYVTACRIEAARRVLASTRRDLAEVAKTVGFGHVETFHRAFRRAQGTTPVAYRERFTSRMEIRS